MAYATYRCPTPGCARSERAARRPHWNPCPECREPVGFYVEVTTPPPSAVEPSPPAPPSSAAAVTFADGGVP